MAYDGPSAWQGEKYTANPPLGGTPNGDISDPNDPVNQPLKTTSIMETGLVQSDTGSETDSAILIAKQLKTSSPALRSTKLVTTILPTSSPRVPVAGPSRFFDGVTENNTVDMNDTLESCETAEANGSKTKNSSEGIIIDGKGKKRAREDFSDEEFIGFTNEVGEDEAMEDEAMEDEAKEDEAKEDEAMEDEAMEEDESERDELEEDESEEDESEEDESEEDEERHIIETVELEEGETEEDEMSISSNSHSSQSKLDNDQIESGEDLILPIKNAPEDTNLNNDPENDEVAILHDLMSSERLLAESSRYWSTTVVDKPSTYLNCASCGEKGHLSRDCQHIRVGPL